jgi:hypothetical protein
MPKMSRNAQVLRYLLEVAPGVGRIKLVKYAYLADCEAYRYLGRAISTFKYRFDKHGPFDRAFFEAKDELVAAGYATETATRIGPYDGYDYRPTDQPVEYEFSQAEVEVLRYVAETYLNESAIRLCEDVVYKTPPMRGAKVGERLKMEKMSSERDPLGFDLERLLAAEASVAAGRYRPLKDAVDELRARHRA